MKVLHLPTSIGGMSWGLAQGERALGLLSDVLVLYDNFHQYPADRIIFKEPPKYITGKAFDLFTRIKEVLKIRNKYDVFHFNCGTTLIDLWSYGLPLIDLPLYKGRGKIVVTYNGCDARQKYPAMKRNQFSPCHDDRCFDGICNDGKRDAIKKNKIEKFDKYADIIFAVNPDLLHFLPEKASFLPYAISRWDEIETLPYRTTGKEFKVVHSPTNRVSKGTGVIIEALNNLKRKYGNIEIILVENMANKKALEIYEKADLVIDQVQIGWYGGFAVEAMKMGKPVAVFIKEDDLRFIPKNMAEDLKEAVININPSNMEDVLNIYLQNPAMLVRKSLAGIEYVRKWHDPKYVASLTKERYESI